MTPTHFLHVPINESLWRAIRQRRETTGESTAETWKRRFAISLT